MFPAPPPPIPEPGRARTGLIDPLTPRVASCPVQRSASLPTEVGAGERARGRLLTQLYLSGPRLSGERTVLPGDPEESLLQHGIPLDLKAQLPPQTLQLTLWPQLEAGAPGRAPQCPGPNYSSSYGQGASGFFSSPPAHS